MDSERNPTFASSANLAARRNGHRPQSAGAVKLVSFEAIDDSPTEEPEGSVVDAINLIRARIWIIVLVVLFAGATGGALTLIQPPIYQAQATMELHPQAENIAGLPGGVAIGSQPQSYLDTQVKILESHTLRSRVLAALNARGKVSSYTQVDNVAAWLKALGSNRQSSTTTKRTGIPEFELKVRGFENTDVVEISCDSPDPNFSADYVNTATEEFMKLNLDSRWAAYQLTNQWLNKQIADTKGKLEQSERDLQAYGASSGLLYTDDKDLLQSEKLKQVQAELSKAQADRVAKQAAYEIAMSASAESVGQVADNDRLSGYQAKLTEMRRELAELSLAYTPEHYKVIRLKAQIAEVEASLERERQAILTRIRNDYNSARRREDLLRRDYESVEDVVSAQDAKAIHYDVLKRDVETNRQVYDLLLQKVKEASVASALSANNMSVLDPAQPPMRPYKPSLLSNVFKGLGGGLLLALLTVLAAERINRSLRAPGEAPFHLKVPELGVIPACDPVTLGAVPPLSHPRRLLPLGDGADASDRVELITWQNCNSIVAESYRNALASILLSGDSGRPRVILVTSAWREEGKSTAVSNLGISLAEINQKILLIDADMRKPRLHHIFELSNSWGLSDILRERTVLSESPIEALARHTQIVGMSVLPSGPGTVSISNLLYSERMSQLLDRFRKEFDTILIDTPPMLMTPDARILGRLADGAILVIRAGKTTRDAAIMAKQRLIEDKVSVLGTILNGWDSRAKSRYGNGVYGYYSRTTT